MDRTSRPTRIQRKHCLYCSSTLQRFYLHITNVISQHARNREGKQAWYGFSHGETEIHVGKSFLKVLQEAIGGGQEWILDLHTVILVSEGTSWMILEVSLHRNKQRGLNYQDLPWLLVLSFPSHQMNLLRSPHYYQSLSLWLHIRISWGAFINI